eukprot:GSMAST32.ASY1.ANO1.2412.1 assembled CDS
MELPASIGDLCETLCDYTKPIGMRMRSLFYLRSVGGKEAINAICKALNDRENNRSLLRHELAFVLGQMGAASSVPVLEKILRDVTDNAMVRHEAAEAIGAIALPGSVDILKEFSSDLQNEVSETCALALERLLAKEMKINVDPAPPLKNKTLDELSQILSDDSKSLFQRYGALFALRDLNTTSSVSIISQVLQSDQSSALFRHEVAYVCGQLENAVATKALCDALARKEENVMVRHEAAEALGAIGTDLCMKTLEEYSSDTCLAVAQSCIVALDVVNYWSESDSSHSPLSKNEAAAFFAEPLKCSCATRVVTKT